MSASSDNSSTEEIPGHGQDTIGYPDNIDHVLANTTLSDSNNDTVTNKLLELNKAWVQRYSNEDDIAKTNFWSTASIEDLCNRKQEIEKLFSMYNTSFNPIEDDLKTELMR
eukprot:3725480-Ditylum_brightwellii.AAC.1